MPRLLSLSITGLLISISFSVSAAPKDALQQSWNKQVKPIGDSYLSFNYGEKLNELYHSAEPWEQMHYTGGGTIWCNASAFFKQDSIVNGKRRYYSKIQLDPKELLFLDYGDKALFAVTKGTFAEKMIESARYTPIPLIRYFTNEKAVPDKESNGEFSVYKAMVHKTVMRLYVRKADNLVAKITALQNDDLRGDIQSTFIYNDYITKGALSYPKTILIEKVNGKLQDEVRIASADVVKNAPSLLERPGDYKIGEDKTTDQVLQTTKYSDNIHFIELMPTGSRVMVVEFSDFLLVSEAPLNSKNGELIIAEAHKIVPGKPIRYFAFGHHHPDYTGGMRPFIHKGATVLGVKEDKDYISFLANAPHTLFPDSLHLQPRALKWETITDSMTITDGGYKMNIYHIGKRSGHTADYLVFYFPKERLLVEGDLVWIKDGPVEKAGERQAGIYNVIKELHLDVKTIVQGWGLSMNGYKSIIPFGDLEQSVNMK